MRDGTPLILCVDDDPDILASLRIVLESSGYHVVTAASAAEGLEAWAEHAPDLVIVDLMMEHVDSGLALVRDLRARGCTGPVYFLSSAGDYLNDSTDMTALGVSGVFQKPVNPVLLLGLLRSRLAASPVAAR